MKYWVQVGEKGLVVEVKEGGPPSVVLVDGREMRVELDAAAPGIFTLLVDGKPYDLIVPPDSALHHLALSSEPFDVMVEDERRHRLTSTERGVGMVHGAVTVRAPMPGLVSRVDAVEGDQVSAGTRLLVLEAMKMENDITAPRPGRVAAVKVSKGQTVEQGALLVVLE